MSDLCQAMNRYPNFYWISRFDIWINEKFDINITTWSNSGNEGILAKQITNGVLIKIYVKHICNM